MDSCAFQNPKTRNTAPALSYSYQHHKTEIVGEREQSVITFHEPSLSLQGPELWHVACCSSPKLGTAASLAIPRRLLKWCAIASHCESVTGLEGGSLGLASLQEGSFNCADTNNSLDSLHSNFVLSGPRNSKMIFDAGQAALPQVTILSWRRHCFQTSFRPCSLGCQALQPRSMLQACAASI